MIKRERERERKKQRDGREKRQTKRRFIDTEGEIESETLLEREREIG